MNPTPIEYLTHTWNPLAMRCSRVSEGCRHCWHIPLCDRFAANPIFSTAERDAYAGGEIVLRRKELAAPMTRTKPARIGVQFMGDLFHELVFGAIQRDVFCVMRNYSQHTFLVLTKRVERMQAFLRRFYGSEVFGRPEQYSHVWGMATAENQDMANKRVPILLQCPFAIRGVSVEPMLGPVDLYPHFQCWRCGDFGKTWDGLTDHDCPECNCNGADRGNVNGGLDWVIIGCESGPKRRPCKLEWVRDLVQQCQAAGVPCFVKQLDIDGKVSKDPAAWPEDLRVREYPCVS